MIRIQDLEHRGKPMTIDAQAQSARVYWCLTFFDLKCLDYDSIQRQYGNGHALLNTIPRNDDKLIAE